MFGEKLDTFILDFLTHNKNLKHESDIQSSSERLSTSYNPSSEDFDKFISRAGKNFNWNGKKVLDVACGKGDFIHFLSKNGVSKAVGIDIQSENILVAKSHALSEGRNNSDFIHGDFFKWETNEKFDYVVSNEALDHIPNVYKALDKMKNLINDDGAIINICGEFWKGPNADHCGGFMKIFIPWRHLIFNERAVFNIRKKKFRPDDPGEDFKSIRGGLSKYTLSSYENSVQKLNLNIIAHSINFQVKSLTRFPLLNKILSIVNNILLQIPFVGEYFAFSLISVLKK